MVQVCSSMAVPTYDAMLRPFLEELAVRDSVSLREVREALAVRFALSDEDLSDLLPSGRQLRFDNRVGWARTYLGKAGLISSPSRGVYQLTQSGRVFLEQHDGPIGLPELRTVEAFANWEEASSKPARTTAKNGASKNIDNASGATPTERVEAAIQEMELELVDQVLESLLAATWQRFEQIVIDVLLALGYGGNRQEAGRAFKRSGDSGVDGVIHEDRLGFSTIYVQAKRRAPDHAVSRPDVQAFVGSLLGHKSRLGAFITTSRFTSEAREYAASLADQRVILIGGNDLAKYMIQHGVGVTTTQSYELKRIDTDYYTED